MSGNKGRQAELAAARFLESRGWRLLERNWRCRAGEIDLIALDGDAVVFVEVKARGTRSFGAPEEALDAGKRARLARAASLYLQGAGLAGRPVRFDLIAAEGGELRHYPSAFDTAGFGV